MLRPTHRFLFAVRFSNHLPDHLLSKKFPRSVRSIDDARKSSIIPKPDPKQSPEYLQERTALSWQDRKIQYYLAEHTVEERLHLYRSLLRALTYIPDSWARTVLRDRIRTEFKKYKPDLKTIGGAQRYHRRLKKALGKARSIQRAGNGHREDLEKVLLAAYGRFGKRRRELVEDLLKADAGELPMTVPLHKSFAGNKLLETLKELPALKHLSTQKLSAFIKSQKEKPPPESGPTRSKIKGVIPAIPKANVWGRSVPKGRQINIIKKWWAEILEKLSPPVPQSEWDRLRDLSRGVIPIPERIPRRAYRKPREEAERKHEMVLEQLKSPRTGGNVAFDSKQGLYIQDQERDEDTMMTPQNYHRTMRRLYSSIWNQTPVMWKDEETKEWHVKWGEMKSEFHSGEIPQASEQDPFFQGLPESQPQRGHRKVPPKLREEAIRDQQKSEQEDTSEWVKVNPDQLAKAKAEYKKELKAIRKAAKKRESTGEQTVPS